MKEAVAEVLAEEVGARLLANVAVGRWTAAVVKVVDRLTATRIDLAPTASQGEVVVLQALLPVQSSANKRDSKASRACPRNLRST